MRRFLKLAVVPAVAVGTLLTGLAGMAGPASASVPSGPIKIGALFTLSGPSAAFGTNEQQIENLLVARLNAQGGIDGHQVKLIALNDQGDVSDAVSAANELVQDGVSAIMYPGTTSTNLQTVPIFMKAKIPVITYDPLDTWANGKKWPYLFNTYPLNKPSMVAEANYIKSQGIKTVALLRDDTPFADELVPDFVAAAKADHIKIASQQTYPATAVNVTTEVSQLKATGAGTLVLIAQVGIGTVYSGLSSVSWAPNVVGTAVDYFEGYTSLGDLSNKSYANCGVAVKKGQNLDPSTLKLVNLVVGKTGSQPDYASTIVNVNDDLLILKYAITKAKSVSGPSVASAVETIRNKSFTSPDYKYTFTKSNHAGFPASSAHTCLLSPLGQDGTPIIAAP